MVGQWRMKWSTINLAAIEVGGGAHLHLHKQVLGYVASPPAQGLYKSCTSRIDGRGPHKRSLANTDTIYTVPAVKTPSHVTGQ